MKLKKIVAGLLIATQLTCVGVYAEDEVTFVQGDPSLNAKVELQDAQLTLKHALGIVTLEDEVVRRADMDADGKITIKDASLVLRKAIGLDISLVCETSCMQKGDAFVYEPSFINILTLSSYFNSMNPAKAGKLDYLLANPEVIVTNIAEEKVSLYAENGNIESVSYFYVKRDGSIDEGVVAGFSQEFPVKAEEYKDNRYGGFIYIVKLRDGSVKYFTFVDKADFDRLNSMEEL